MTWMPIEGGCQCGRVRYRLTEQPLQLNVCHCLDCQKQSGSAFGMSLVILPTSLELTGELATFEIEAASGRRKTGAFCPGCGVRIYNRTERLCSIKAGTLDNAAELRPDGHYWVSRKQDWLQLDDEIPCHEFAGND